MSREKIDRLTGKIRKVLVPTGAGIIVPQIAKECAQTLLKLGFPTVLMDVRQLPPDCDSRKLYSILRDISPDMVVAIDNGIVRDIPEVFRELGVPVVAWFVDNPLYVMTPKNIIDNLYIFSWDRAFIEPVRKLGAGFVEYLPLATNPAICRRIPRDDPRCRDYLCDVSFVGSSLADSYPPEVVETMPSGARNIFYDCSEQHSQMPHRTVPELIVEAERRQGVQLGSKAVGQMNFYVTSEAMMRYRSRAINRLAKFEPHVYGDDGWKMLLGPGPVFRGRMDYENDINKLYSATRVNVNMSKSQLVTSVNQRVFDAPACGGFVLTDNREDAFRLFDTDNEIAVFSSMEELEEKTAYFLENEEERERRARQARRNVLSNHTYLVRMREMLAMLADAL